MKEDGGRRYGKQPDWVDITQDQLNKGGVGKKLVKLDYFSLLASNFLNMNDHIMGAKGISGALRYGIVVMALINGWSPDDDEDFPVMPNLLDEFYTQYQIAILLAKGYELVKPEEV